MIKLYRSLVLLLLFVITGCAGLQPFNYAARAGDTIAIAAGWKHQFSRDQLTVTFQPPVGDDIVYSPGHDSVRASINFYADPTSYMAVGSELYDSGDVIDDPKYYYGATYGSTMTAAFTDLDPDWWQTTVVVDLPSSLPVGNTNVLLTSSGSLGEGLQVPVQIIEGDGSPHTLPVEMMGAITDYQLRIMERAPNYEVQFTGATVPHAIQVDLTH
ncbi:MAG: hypothetical protein OQK32_04140, partial [Gammaproteobacteria bacterium]|nr:hypothetical protein [Gammaproteobacteria bacterium]